MNPVLLAILAAAGIAWAISRDPSPSGMTPNRRGGKVRFEDEFRMTKRGVWARRDAPARDRYGFAKGERKRASKKEIRRRKRERAREFGGGRKGRRKTGSRARWKFSPKPGWKARKARTLRRLGISWADMAAHQRAIDMTPNRRGSKARVVESYRKRRGKRHVVGRESRKRALEFKARRGTKWEKPSSTKRSIQQRREAMKTLVEAQRYAPGEFMIRFHTTNAKQAPKVKRWLKRSGLRLTEHGQVVSEVGTGREDWGSIGTDHHGDVLDLFVDAKRTFDRDVKNGSLGITVAIPSPNPRKSGEVKWYTAGGGGGLAMWERVAWAAAQNPHLVQSGARWAVGSALGVPDPSAPATDLATPIKYVGLGLALGLVLGYLMAGHARTTRKEADAGG